MISKGSPPNLWSDRLIDRLAYAHDASMYRLIPKGVARPENESDVVSLLIFTFGIHTSRKLDKTTKVSITSPALMNR